MSGYWDKNPGAIEALRDLWAKGLPASVIASTLELQFRSAITRNAVLGKVHRLGLNNRIDPVKEIFRRAAHQTAQRPQDHPQCGSRHCR
jgi:GcrA cell cycle regulator